MFYRRTTNIVALPKTNPNKKNKDQRDSRRQHFFIKKRQLMIKIVSSSQKKTIQP